MAVLTQVNNKFFGFVAQLLLIVVLLVLQTLTVSADSRRSQQYSYDSAGNLTQSISLLSANPPVITSINSSYINVGRTIYVQATGTDLFGAQVAVSYPRLTVSNVSSTATQITFSLTASDIALTGTAIMAFTTSLGSDSASIIVADRAPTILTTPNPIALLANSQLKSVQITLDPIPDVSSTYNLNVSNSTIAVLEQSTVIL